MKNFIKDWVIPVVAAVIVVYALNTFVFKLVTVPTGSMISVILPGDKLYVNKLIDLDNIQRGDIIVFWSKERQQNMVKRTIGIPKDKVEIKQNGEVYINGKKIDEPYAANSTSVGKIFEVPEDSYFFLGDNRSNSIDARHWNNPYINKKDIVGKVVFRFFPFDRIGFIE